MKSREEYQCELLTPCLCHGADPEGDGELRVASIRGQIREWRRMRGNERHAIEDVWGGSQGRKMLASKVALEVGSVQGAATQSAPLLPHKGGPKRGAVPANASFTLTLRRLVGCDDALWAEAQRDVETWLLLGCLGQRGNRAAGSVWCVDWDMSSLADFENRLCAQQIPHSWDVQLCKQTLSAEEARKTASDTMNGFPELFGGIKPRREPSPTKMKVVKIAGKCKLLIVAKNEIVSKALEKLKRKPDNRRWCALDFERIILRKDMTQ